MRGRHKIHEREEQNTIVHTLCVHPHMCIILRIDTR